MINFQIKARSELGTVTEQVSAKSTATVAATLKECLEPTATVAVTEQVSTKFTAIAAVNFEKIPENYFIFWRVPAAFTKKFSAC